MGINLTFLRPSLALTLSTIVFLFEEYPLDGVWDVPRWGGTQRHPSWAERERWRRPRHPWRRLGSTAPQAPALDRGPGGTGPFRSDRLLSVSLQPGPSGLQTSLSLCTQTLGGRQGLSLRLWGAEGWLLRASCATCSSFW